MENTKRQDNMEYLSDKKFILGIDPCGSRMDCVLMDIYKNVIGKPFSFPVSSKGFNDTFYKKLGKNLNYARSMKNKITGKMDIQRKDIVVAIEHAINFWQNVSHFCHREGFSVVLVNPLTTKHSRPLHNADFSKTDSKDAFLIGENTGNGNFIKYLPSKDLFQQGKQLSIYRSKLSKDLQRAKGRVDAVLKIRFPECNSIVNSSTKTARYLLKQFADIRSFKTMDVDDVYQTVKKVSNGQFKIETIEKLKTAVNNSIGIPFENEEIANDAEFIMTQMIGAVIELDEKINSLDEKLISCFKNVPYFAGIISLKGVSEVTAAIFIAECGDLNKYTSYKQIEKLAGLNLVLADSGKYSGPRKVSKIGNKRLRTVLYLICTQLSTYEPGIRKKFLKRQMKNRTYKKNIIALCSNVLRLIMALVKQNRVYIEDKKQIEETKILEFKYLQIQKKAA